MGNIREVVVRSELDRLSELITRGERGLRLEDCRKSSQSDEQRKQGCDDSAYFQLPPPGYSLVFHILLPSDR